MSVKMALVLSCSPVGDGFLVRVRRGTVVQVLRTTHAYAEHSSVSMEQVRGEWVIV